ncbi:MAG: PH domain-containing protein [Pseudonocardiaceae bacterium]
MIGRHANVLLPPSVERRVIRVRRHWAILLRPLLETVGIVIAAFVLSSLINHFVRQGIWPLQSVLWYVAVAALMRFAWKVLEWWIEEIVVTDKRFMITKGVVQTQNSMVPITKVTDMTFLRPFVGQLLGYGTLRVESAGKIEGLEQIEYVPRPEEVFMAISELIFGEKKQPRSHMLEPPRRSTRRTLWRSGR